MECLNPRAQTDFNLLKCVDKTWQRHLCYSFMKIRLFATCQWALQVLIFFTGRSYRQLTEVISVPDFPPHIRWTKGQTQNIAVVLELGHSLKRRDEKLEVVKDESIEVKRCWCNTRHTVIGYLETECLPCGENLGVMEGALREGKSISREYEFLPLSTTAVWHLYLQVT